MALIVISVNRDKLPRHTDEEFEAWIKYEVGEVGRLEKNNKLIGYELMATVKEFG